MYFFILSLRLSHETTAMSGKSEMINAKRRLDLSSASSRVENPYLKVKALKSEYCTRSEEDATSSTTTPNLEQAIRVKNPYLKVPKSESISNSEEGATSSTITPEAGIEKFFASKRKAGDRDVKPQAARKLVTPRNDNTRQPDNELKKGGHKRRSLKFTSEDDKTNDLYYHSDDESHSKNMTKKKRLYEPGHIHASLDYHHRGDLPLDQGTLRAYRFIRNHFLVPKDIEADPKFGAYSGSCFEERVIRAYSLGQLKPKKKFEGTENSLLVCSYCGGEGHMRGNCSQLL